MRDKQQIEDMCSRLKRAWMSYPQWRLGQLIANGVRGATGAVNCDPFYIEDEKLMNGIEVVCFGKRTD